MKDVDTKEQIKVFSGVCLEDKNHFIILLVVLTCIYAPFSRSFATKNALLSTKTKVRFCLSIAKEIDDIQGYSLNYLEKCDIIPTNKLHLEENQDGFG